jgi:hypothetical protein
LTFAPITTSTPEPSDPVLHRAPTEALPLTELRQAEPALPSFVD